MNELLKINYETEQPTVSARDLHAGLEIKSKYADWFKNMSTYGFTENEDYMTVSKNLENGGRIIEHFISVDMAKQICMIQRNEKGPKSHFHTATSAQPQKNIVIPRSVPRMDASISVFTSSIVIGCHLTFLVVDGRISCRPDCHSYDYH